MLDFYHEIAGLESEMTLNELKQELLKQEKVWTKRQVNTPEKATKMLSIIFDAKKAFETESSRKKYDRELELSKKEKTIDPDEQRKARLKEWTDKARTFYEDHQFELAGNAYEKARVSESPDGENADFYNLGYNIFCELGNFYKALECTDKEVIAEPDNCRSYFDREYVLRQMAIQEAQNSRVVGSANPYYDKALNANQKLCDMAQKYGMTELYANALGQRASILYSCGEYTEDNCEEVQEYANKSISLGATNGVANEVLEAMKPELEEYKERNNYIRQLEEQTANYKKRQQEVRGSSKMGVLVFVVSVVLAYLTCGVVFPISTLIAAAGIAYGCYKSAQGRSSLVLVCSVIWLFAYSIMRSTKLYTVLGYGAASAAVVQKKFICNIVFLIVIAVAANIVGKMKKK